MAYGGNTTCMEVKIPGSDKLLIFDCGTGFVNLGNTLASERKAVTDGRIFITHPHWDHIQGIPFFKPFFCNQNNFTIHMPEQIWGGCKKVLTDYLADTFFPIQLEMMDASIECVTQTEEKQQFEGYSIEFMLANHPIRTAMFKISIGDAVIVFAPDNELTHYEHDYAIQFQQEFREFITGADLLIHDAQYNNKQYSKKVGWGHSSWEKITGIAYEAGIKRLFLTHHEPDHDDPYLRQLDETISKLWGDKFDEISLVKEGTTLLEPVRNSKKTLKKPR